MMDNLTSLHQTLADPTPATSPVVSPNSVAGRSTESQKRGVGSDLWGSSNPTPLLNLFPCRWLHRLGLKRPHHLPVSVLCVPHRKEVLPHDLMQLPELQFVPTAPHPVTAHNSREPNPTAQKGSTELWCVSLSSQLCATCKPAEGGLHPFVQVTDGDVEQQQIQHRPSGNSTSHRHQAHPALLMEPKVMDSMSSTSTSQGWPRDHGNAVCVYTETQDGRWWLIRLNGKLWDLSLM